MSTTTAPATPRAPRLTKLGNVPMRAVLALPFPTPLSGRLMLLHLTGRRSGRRYRIPVSYIEHEGALLTPGGGRWRLNLVDGRPERVRLRGRDVRLAPELVGDVEEVNRLLCAMAAANPMIGRFMPLPRDAAGEFDRETLRRAAQHGFRVIRWHAVA